MHRMNANHVSEGTSTLGDDAIRRIASKVGNAQTKRVQKHAVKEELVAGPVTTTTVQNRSVSHTIKIAGLQDIPSEFEKMGTGFYRRGHHLWELAPMNDGGFVLVRKGGEDHVLGYDPEPIVRQTVVTDRHGQTIKVGSKVILPHRGKVAAGTVVVIQPGSMNIEMDSGEKIDSPPDMCELLSPAMGGGFEIEAPEMEDVMEDEEGGGSDIESSMGSGIESAAEPTAESTEAFGAEFSPSIEPSSKAEPEVEEPESEEVEEDEEPEEQDEVEEEPFTGEEPEAGETKEHEESETPEEERAEHREAMTKTASVDDPIEIWRNYWHGIGNKMAKQTKEEAASKRRERRDQRKRERQGLPKGVKLPPKPPAPKTAGSDDLAQLKEQNRLYQQCFEELEYILQDESLKMDQEALAGAIDGVLQEYHDQLDEMGEEREESMEDELSIEKPADEHIPTQPTTSLPKMSKKIVVSMGNL